VKKAAIPTLHTTSQGCLYFQNTVGFHGTSLIAIPFTSITKVTPSLRPFLRYPSRFKSSKCRFLIQNCFNKCGRCG